MEMNDRKDKNRQDSKNASILNQLNNSIFGLANHLNQYIGILRQSSVRPK